MIVWLIVSNLVSIGLVETRYQEDVIPSLSETYNKQFLRIEETFKKKTAKEEPEKIVCYSRTDILEMMVNSTTEENVVSNQ